ncbi:MAG: magnesium transporter CorA family protein [Anaerolineales bacterium]|jgi:magnesium transporter|uniref:magnesium transporter CorA family protein n=1 Tax=Candidatus Villigracilis vicinus TaxID=3140679 RepID=UPI003135E3DA|nr:magnesium transporter CorA family protein [Anaerolineales bacterium]MBK7450453.1 magnesium transporter CorA family protein [Anaerolineales bacterium]MBK9780286.1 magnesium transporter CorA family protein [Anaerolineales bacterium]
MLSIYKNTESGFETLEMIANGAWVNVVDPSPEEIEKLVNWGMDMDYVNYSLDQDEMPRMERDEDYTFILLRIPIHQPDSDIPYNTVPLGIMILGNKIITVCRYDSDIFKSLTNGKYKQMKTGKRYRLTLYIFLETAARYLNLLREINRATELVEDRLQKSTQNRELLELLKYQKSLTYFATALRSNEVMMERVQRTQLFNYYEEDQDLLEDVLTENQQAIQMTTITTEILSSMMDAFASIISNNLNVVMKALAALTIILNVPTIVASFYGMNVNLPGEGHPLAFLTVIGLSLGLTAMATYIFYKRNWF